ncbi:serine carboxypeptidase [Coniophora puteana RWD-64-598 SS2]|uniref:Carboxypeptidase n=1 Tax=Coniophora puteana (strain RWD-64-598) TaxID=741705 RepID=R7SEC6_CONPW|nr:serine carboxypeptidase [Coniophora puteana RWD-64-598 SS2]EIW74533.1 serine carboxypeptidase [Coniophora puteana RWD-64-598 SS2]
MLLSALSIGLGLVASVSQVAGARQSQSVFQPPAIPNPHVSYDDGLFAPLEHLSVLQSETYSTLAHPAFPNHSVRIKKSDFCDAGVNAYSGYIDIEARHLFFYFFESRNDPSADDVILWTNGGPGCSSSLGLFMELGPCRVTTADGPTYNPYAWNENANVFFIDQPVGVGFSYADYGESVSTTEEAAKDIAAFVSIFFENFSQFRGRAFHMSGESYGGRYIPAFASEVYDQNARLEAAGITPINLQSVMIGNGMTDYVSMGSAYVDMACTNASVPPVASISSCIAAKQAIPRCLRWTKESCLDTFDAISCGAARTFCESYLETPFWETGLNPYDISKPCEGDIADTLCYPETKYITNFLDRPTVRTALGVDPSLSAKNFSSCSDDVGSAFNQNLDEFHPMTEHVAQLLERGVRALIYVGDYDWICNWLGNERWTLDMAWTGHEEFSGQGLREWFVDGEMAGKTRAAKGLTFATVHAAGHMVPYDKPQQALALVQRWLAKEEL